MTFRELDNIDLCGVENLQSKVQAQSFTANIISGIEINQ